MSMTKKDYELIADVIKENFESFKSLEVHPSHYQHLLVSELAKALHQDNVRFDWRKFKQACGVIEGKE